MTISENDPRHLFQRILKAKDVLEPVKPQYCIVWERPGEDNVSVTTPSPEWLAMAMAGGFLPPVDVYHQLRCHWVHEDGRECETSVNEHPGEGWKGGNVVNGHLLHETPPVNAMSEEAAMEYLLQKDIPRKVWEDHERSNHRRFLICTVDQIPKDRTWRNTWRVAQD